MGKTKRVRRTPPAFLEEWRISLHLSRRAVAERLTELLQADPPIDQATVAKWESGETAVRVEDFELLAKVYGVTPDRLFFPPADADTPKRLARAWEVLAHAEGDAIERWLALGEELTRKRAG